MLKASLEAMASGSSPRAQNLEQQVGAGVVELRVSQLIDAEQVDAAVTGDGLVELLVDGGLDQLVTSLAARVY
nr:hypothetical protein [Actinomadura madurae]